jgi:uncharacterized membrane protein
VSGARRGAVFLWEEEAGKFILAASLIYLISVIGVTMVFNVPLNDALAPLAPASPEAAELWTRYLRKWTFWNHLRTIAPIVSAVLFVAGLLNGG